MRIFIDESGSFSGFHEGSLAVVAALAIPESRLVNIEKKFAKIRRTLPLSKGEVKGKNLSEGQVAQVVTILARNEALLEATVVDIGAHTEAGVAAYKQALAKGMTN